MKILFKILAVLLFWGNIIITIIWADQSFSLFIILILFSFIFGIIGLLFELKEKHKD